MTTITITIAGPGGVINYEAEIIRRALVAAGCTVTYNNDCADGDPEAMVTEVRRRLTDANWGAPFLQPGVITKEVVINVNHIPWGG
jgi:hypothetical protein